jgi:hypothetical protein
VAAQVSPEQRPDVGLVVEDGDMGEWHGLQYAAAEVPSRPRWVCQVGGRRSRPLARR